MKLGIFLAIGLWLPFTSPVIWSRKKKDNISVGDFVKVQVHPNGDWSSSKTIGLTKEECSERKDLGEIVCPKVGLNATCSLFSSWGTRSTSCADLKSDNNVFVVPRGRLFMLPAKAVGTKTEILHLAKPNGKPLVLETLSVTPRIFKLYNFFTEMEADQLIANALSASEEQMRLKRSTISDAGRDIEDSYRTSENAFDTRSEVAQKIKRRLFDLLGIFPFDESLADGIQVLRYQPHTGYGAHMDWIDPPTVPRSGQSDHDWDSAGDGTNRYVTLLMYLSDSEEGSGGETVFPELEHVESTLSSSGVKAIERHHTQYLATAAADIFGGSVLNEQVCAEPNGGCDSNLVMDCQLQDLSTDEQAKIARIPLCSGDEDVTTLDQCIFKLESTKSSSSSFISDLSVVRRIKTNLITSRYLASKNMSHLYDPNSWQFNMLGDCRTKLAVMPRRLEAVLFYNQLPDGRPDKLSLHGGCPVLSGTKWAANLWVWNGPRSGYWSKNSETGRREKPSLISVSVSFESMDVIGGKLFWEDQLWEELTPGRPVKVNSFPGHQWKVRVEDEVIITWTIEADKPSQRFVLTSEDLPSFS